jgi:hypothetical protein
VTRLVLIDVLGQPLGRLRGDLHEHLRHYDTESVDDAIGRLVDLGFVVEHGERVSPTESLRLLEDLDLIAV